MVHRENLVEGGGNSVRPTPHLANSKSGINVLTTLQCILTNQRWVVGGGGVELERQLKLRRRVHTTRHQKKQKTPILTFIRTTRP
jgi:hypothetical protein